MSYTFGERGGERERARERARDEGLGAAEVKFLKRYKQVSLVYILYKCVYILYKWILYKCVLLSKVKHTYIISL